MCVHLFTHKEGQVKPVTIGYKTIDNFHEKIILQNGFRKVSNQIVSIISKSFTKLSSFIHLYSSFFLQFPNNKAGHTIEFN